MKTRYSHNLLHQVKGNTIFTPANDKEKEALLNALRASVKETPEQKAKAIRVADEIINSFKR